MDNITYWYNPTSLNRPQEEEKHGQRQCIPSVCLQKHVCTFTPCQHLRTQNLHGGRQVILNPAFLRDLQIIHDSPPQTPFHLWGNQQTTLCFMHWCQHKSVSLYLQLCFHLSELFNTPVCRKLQVFQYLYLSRLINHNDSELSN